MPSASGDPDRPARHRRGKPCPVSLFLSPVARSFVRLERPPHMSGLVDCASIDVAARIVDVELAGRRDEPWVLDHAFQLERLVVDNHQRGRLVFRVPDREPDLIAGLVELALHDTPLAFGYSRPLPDRK